MKKDLLGSKKERFEVLLEDITSNVQVMAEQSVQQTNDIVEIKKTLLKHGDKLTIMQDKLSIMQMDINVIKHDIKQKVNLDEFKALEHRVMRLEHRL